MAAASGRESTAWKPASKESDDAAFPPARSSAAAKRQAGSSITERAMKSAMAEPFAKFAELHSSTGRSTPWSVLSRAASAHPFNPSDQSISRPSSSTTSQSPSVYVSHLKCAFSAPSNSTAMSMNASPLLVIGLISAGRFFGVGFLSAAGPAFCPFG